MNFRNERDFFMNSEKELFLKNSEKELFLLIPEN